MTTENFDHICPDCGDVYLTQPFEYRQEHPNGASVEAEEAWYRHVSGSCSHSEKHDIVDVCECGEVVWSASAYDWRYNHNGCCVGRDQARSEHYEWMHTGEVQG